MDAEHGEHEHPVEALVEMCRRLEADPSVLPELDDLAAVAAALRDDFTAHLEVEERVIFPAIERLIDADEQAVMIAELAARRDP
jgi:hemerythrin-like domain-containing protein